MESAGGGEDTKEEDPAPAAAAPPAAASKSSSTTAVWRNPSAAHLAKYGLVPLPQDFTPTPQEQMLLDMYDTVKNLERTAAKIREDAARAKLDARNVEFQEKMAAAKKQKKKQRRATKKRVKTLTEDDDAMDDDDDDDEDDDDESGDDEDDSEMEEAEGEDNEEDEPQSKYERREKEIAALREEVETAKQNPKESEEAARRAHHLAEADAAADMIGGPVMRKNKAQKLTDDNQDAAAGGGASLIANLAAAGATPPHEFSKSLGLTPLKGTVLFPNKDSPQDNKWTPPTEKGHHPNEGAFLAELDDFDVGRASQSSGSHVDTTIHNNTLAVKFTAPADSRRFSINIALEAEHDDFDSILFHFNPRQRERGGQLIINDKKQGIWGQAIAVPLSQIPMLFGQTACTLLVQITGEGFDIFIDKQHCARLEHRTEIPSGSTKLVVQFPAADDYGMPEKWTVYKVWWGHVKPMAKEGDVSGVPGVKSFNALHPRKLFVTGLTKVFTQPDVDVRRAELERAFRRYGGSKGAAVIVPTNSTYAFVELESEAAADRALHEMSSKYSLNRARRTKHEALQEERAAKEAAARGEVGAGKKGASDGWG